MTTCTPEPVRQDPVLAVGPSPTHIRGALERGDKPRETAPSSQLEHILRAPFALGVRAQKRVGVQLEESGHGDGGRVEDVACTVLG